MREEVEEKTGRRMGRIFLGLWLSWWVGNWNSYVFTLIVMFIHGYIVFSEKISLVMNLFRNQGGFGTRPYGTERWKILYWVN